MKKLSRVLAIVLVLAMVLPGLAQAATLSAAKDVDRIAGANRWETAVAASKEAYDSADTVVVVNGRDYADALTGTVLAHAEKAPLLLVDRKNDAVPAAVEKEIKRLGAEKVIIVGGPVAVSEKMEAALEKLVDEVERVKGDNRYETAVEVAKAAKVSKDLAFLVKGDDFADALAVGPVAALKNAPIFLTKTDKLNDATKEALEDYDEVVVVGGKVAVSDAVYKAAGADERVEGANRWATAIEVAKKYFAGASAAYLANGRDFPDALVAGYLGAKNNTPVLLTDKDSIKADVVEYLDGKEVTILGGESAVGKKVVDALEAEEGELKVVSVSAINAKEIQVKFNRAVDKGSATNATNYEVKVGNEASGRTFTVEQDKDNKSLVTLTITDVIQAIVSVEVKVKKDIMAENYQKLTEDYKTAFIFYDSEAPSIVSAVVDGNELTVQFSEYIAATPLFKVDGKEVTTSDTTFPTKKVKFDISSLNLKDGSYTFTAANVNDLQSTPNLAPFLSATIYVSDAAKAPQVKKVTAKSATTFEIEFDKALKAAPTVKALKGGANMVKSVTTVSASKYTVTVGDVSGVADLYATGENSVNLSVTISGFQAISNNLYGNSYTTTLNLRKDTTGPVLLPGYNKVLTGNTVIQLRFDEEVQVVDANKVTVVNKDGVRLTVSGVVTVPDADSDNTFVNVTMSTGLEDGVHNVTFNKGAVKDLSGNENLSFTTTVAKGATSSSDTLTANPTVTNNVITVAYGEEMGASAISSANYTLDNKALPAGTVIYFSDTDKDEVIIELPAGSIANSNARLFSISANVVAKSGASMKASVRNQVITSGWVDNVKPTLVSATKDTTTTIKVKFSEAMQAGLASLDGDSTPTLANVLDDFKVKVNGVEIAITGIANDTDDDTIILTVATYNKTQNVTVEIVKDNLNLADTAANVVVGNKVVTAN